MVVAFVDIVVVVVVVVDADVIDLKMDPILNENDALHLFVFVEWEIYF